MAVRLFVGNLPYDATEAELRDHFSAIGAVSYISLPRDRETGKPRGFAFVEFNERSQAEEAIRRFNNQLFRGRPMAVNEARAREDRPRPGMSSPGASFRPSSLPDIPLPDPAARGDRPTRNFGPDAKPARNRGKGKGSPKSERAPKGPMREVVRGQFFGGDEDDSYDDDFDGENFASRENDSEYDDEGDNES